MGDDPFALDGFGDCKFVSTHRQAHRHPIFQLPRQPPSSALAAIIRISPTRRITTITSCHHFTVRHPLVTGMHHSSYLFAEDDNDVGHSLLNDHQAPATRMETDEGVTHIPGVDDTTLLSNVSDEFVLPPISTAGKLNETKGC